MTASVLTQSAVRTYLECPRKYQWAYEECIRPDKQADALRFGSLFHGVFERIDRYEDWQNIVEWCVSQAADQYEAQTVLSLAAAHRWHYADRDAGLHVVDVEGVFSTDMDGVSVAGKYDAIIELDGRRLLREYKTSSEDISPGSLYWQRLQMDLQVSIYLEATGLDSVLYDVIRKPTVRPKMVPITDELGLKVVTDDATGERVYNKNGTPRQSGGEGMTLQSRLEAPHEWGDRLREDINSRPDYYFQRAEIARFAADRKQAIDDLRDVHQAISLQLFPRNTAACCRYGKCCYFDLCASGVLPGDDTPLGFTRITTPHQELTDGASEDEDTATPAA